ncbi:MAG TPA: peptidoglycan -binding protein [Xanthobacteraceae bacterium]|nr:peptidoglycan -binding protein [Xanthobacteraceae bacterium]
MALARTRRSESGMNYWPGFVDALSTLILSIIFLLSIFVVVQFYLQQEVQGQSSALKKLDAQVGQLSDLLSMEKGSNADLQKQLSGLQATLATTQDTLTSTQATLTATQSDRDKYKGLAAAAAADAAAAQADRDKYKGLSAAAAANAAAAQTDRDKYKALYEGAETATTAAQSKAGELSSQLTGEKDISAKALAEVDTLNQQVAALRTQLAALNSALGISEKKDQDSQQRIADLGQKLNLALAKDVQQLSAYRSDFFGKLRQILGNRPDIRIVGDRFVLQSEIFFDSGSANLKPEGSAELDKVASAVIALEGQIPPDIPWVLRVDGHTDVRPVLGQFKSNWDLSAARAIAVVKYLVAKGVQPNRLVAAGFGEFQPIDTGNTEEAYRKNRRIEFKLTER